MARSRQDQGSDEDEDEAKTGAALGVKRKFDEFDCPTCNANNPFETFGNGDEVLCNWCGISFKALIDDEGALRLREL